MKKLLKKLLYILGFLWCLPVSILGWIFLGILTLFKQIDEIKVLPNLAFVWEIKKETWFHKLGIDWFGWVFGNNIILYEDIDKVRKYRSFYHELEHVMQNYCWGIFFYPAYILESSYLWLFKKKVHAYLFNHFERAARKAAGQPVEISPSNWLDGPKDRWPWW
jgi:hypothetical protein